MKTVMEQRVESLETSLEVERRAKSELRRVLKGLMGATWGSGGTKCLTDARTEASKVYVGTLTDEERNAVVQEAQRQQESAPPLSFLARSEKIKTFDEALTMLGTQLLDVVGI